jgi:hypothetical protein
MGANTVNLDLAAYKNAYNLTPLNRDFGYALVSMIFKFLGFNYEIFRLTWSVIGLVLINLTVKKLLTSSNKFYLVYFIFPFFVDVIQVRNFLAMAIMIFAIPYLLSEKRYDTIKFIGLILVASSLHVIALTYIPLVLLLRLRVSNKVRNFYIFLIILFVLMFFLRSYIYSLTEPIVVLLKSKSIRGISYLQGRTKIHAYVPLFINFMELFIILWADKIYNNLQKSSNLNILEIQNFNYKLKFIKLVKYINYYTMLFIPLYLFSLSFYRISRNILLLNFIACLIVIDDSSKEDNKEIQFFGNIFIFSVLILAFLGLKAQYTHVNLFEMVTNNWILDIFVR